MQIRCVFALLLAIASTTAYRQANPDEPAKSVQVSGRVVFPGGHVESGLSVQVEEIDPGGGTPNHPGPVITDTRGVFMFSGSLGATYCVSLGPGLGPSVQTPPKTIQITSEKAVDIGDMVFEKIPAIHGTYANPPTTPPPLIGNLKLEQIVIEPQRFTNDAWARAAEFQAGGANSVWTNSPVESPKCWSLSLAQRQQWEGLCAIEFTQFLSIEEFVGGKVKTIRVVRYDPRLTPDQIKAEVRKVWLGIFHYATCQPGWAEGNLWNILAMVEYDDGRKSSILTDGGHVQVQDREGKYWYMREWPAVD
jgi:hypothetical protein